MSEVGVASEEEFSNGNGEVEESFVDGCLFC